MTITEPKHFRIAAVNLMSGLTLDPRKAQEDVDWVEAKLEDAFTDGRVSVLRDFDNMCAADAFVGYSEAEWSAIKRFFEHNKLISGWDKN